jgi:hypothetical protein
MARSRYTTDKSLVTVVGRVDRDALCGRHDGRCMSIEDYVAASTEAQGLPLKVENPDVLRSVAALVMGASQLEVSAPSRSALPVNPAEAA